MELVYVSPPAASFSGLLAGLRLLFGFASTVIHFLAMEKVSCYLSHRTQTVFNQAALRGFVCPKLTELVICNDLSSLSKFSFPVMGDNWVSCVTGANPSGSTSQLLGVGHGGAWKALMFPVMHT